MTTDRVHASRMIATVDEETQSQNKSLLRNFIDETGVRLSGALTNIPRDSECVAVFVGWHHSDRLEYVFRNVLHFLGPGWGLQVITWKDLMRDIQAFTGGWSHVHYTTLQTPSPGPGVLDDLMTRPHFWSMVRGTHLLFFDADSILCDHRIDRFVGYDYIGSPWAAGQSFSPHARVGDGGLSLRRKAAMETIASENQRRNMITREDVFFSLHAALDPERFQVASIHKAQEFSVESEYTAAPFGIHRPWECLPTDQVRSLLATIRYASA